MRSAVRVSSLPVLRQGTNPHSSRSPVLCREAGPVPLSPGNVFIAQKDSFLACEEGIELDIAFTEKIRAGLFGGQGFVLQRMSGQGMVFLQCCGDIIEMELKRGEVVKVQTGLVVGFDATVSFDITVAGGVTTALFGGEGLFVTTLTGPGTVVLQSMDIAKLAACIIPFLPKPEITVKPA